MTKTVSAGAVAVLAVVGGLFFWGGGASWAQPVLSLPTVPYSLITNNSFAVQGSVNWGNQSDAERIRCFAQYNDSSGLGRRADESHFRTENDNGPFGSDPTNFTHYFDADTGTAPPNADLTQGTNNPPPPPPGTFPNIVGPAQRWFASYTARENGTYYFTNPSSPHDAVEFYTEPNPVASVTISAAGDNQFDVSWTPSGTGAGAGVIILVRQAGLPWPAEPAAAYPSDQSASYTADLDYSGAGTAVGTAKVVYFGANGGSPITVTGLASGTTYSVAVFSYVGAGSLTNFEQTSPGTDSATTTVSALPPTLSAATLLDADTKSVRAQIDAAGTDPVTQHGFVWNATGNPETGHDNPTALGANAGPFPTTFTDTNFPASTRIFFEGYGTNVQGTAYTDGNLSFHTEPGNQATNLTFPAKSGTTLDLNWARGNPLPGDGVIVVIGTSATANDPISDGTVYTANADFGNPASETSGGSGNYVVYIGAGTSVQVTGLAGVTGYTVSVYEYEGSGAGAGGVNYRDGDPLTGSATTDPGPPSLSGATVVSADGGTVQATIDGNGGSAITQHGFVWNTTGTPTVGVDDATTLGAYGGGFPHSFNGPLSGLVASTRYYFRGYATKGITTGYSGVGSFYTAPSVQASGVTITNVLGASMQVSWSGSGNGDGVIVLMKQGSAVDAAPVDGTAYSASATFSGGTQLGSGNYVVFLGSGSSVTVAGLAPLTTYHVAVFAYKGTGAGAGGINVLTVSPPRGSDTTASGNTHNYKAGLNCSSCHFIHPGSGSLLARSESQQALCLTCHIVGGVAWSILGKSDEGNHLVNKGTSHVIDCGTCHDVHDTPSAMTSDNSGRAGGSIAQNLTGIRSKIDKYRAKDGASYGPAVEDAVFQTRPDHFVFATPNGSGKYNGICQACHTQTSDFRNSVAPSGTYPHDGAGADCTTNCHLHTGNFYANCLYCHDTTQGARRQIVGAGGDFTMSSVHVSGTVTVKDCMRCHDMSAHRQGTVRLRNPETGGAFAYDANGSVAHDEFCLSCHDGTPPTGVTFPGSTTGTGYDKSAKWAGTNGHRASQGGKGCVGCHNGHGSTWPDLLKNRYDRNDGNNWSSGDYQLCWTSGCHSSNGVMNTDNVFGEHDKHVNGESEPCYGCHDVHGPFDAGEVGNVDFEQAIDAGFNMSYRSGYLGSGAFWPSGGCIISCHGSDKHSGSGGETY